MPEHINEHQYNPELRRAVITVALLNLGYFFVEFAVAKQIGSVSLFADSVDFLEDASVNFLIAVAVGWSIQQRARLGMLLAGILLIPGIALLWTAWQKFLTPSPPRAMATYGDWPWRIGCKSWLRIFIGQISPNPGYLSCLL